MHLLAKLKIYRVISACIQLCVPAETSLDLCFQWVFFEDQLEMQLKCNADEERNQQPPKGIMIQILSRSIFKSYYNEMQNHEKSLRAMIIVTVSRRVFLSQPHSK